MNTTDKIIAALRKVEEAVKELHPLDWHFQRLDDQAALLFNRFCPFKVGDRVRLTKTPDITGRNTPGWMGCKHFLVAGATGVIRNRDAGRKGFWFEVEFDGETWLDDGVPKPVTAKHVFRFDETCLESEGAK